MYLNCLGIRIYLIISIDLGRIFGKSWVSYPHGEYPPPKTIMRMGLDVYRVLKPKKHQQALHARKLNRLGRLLFARKAQT